MNCINCSNPLTDVEVRMALVIKINGRIIEKCSLCVINFITIDASLLERYSKYLERRFKCKGCLGEVKRKYEDIDQRNLCVRCTRGTSASRLDLYSQDTENWPPGHIRNVDQSPAIPSEDTLRIQGEKDRERWNRNGTVAIDAEELADLLQRHDKIIEMQANARNKQISKRMWKT